MGFECQGFRALGIWAGFWGAGEGFGVSGWAFGGSVFEGFGVLGFEFFFLFCGGGGLGFHAKPDLHTPLESPTLLKQGPYSEGLYPKGPPNPIPY